MLKMGKMMSNLLLIDTSERGKTVLALGDSCGIVARRVFRSRFHETGSLLKRIDALLKSKGVSRKRIGGIIVVLGPGPFSSLRGAVTIANSLAFALNIPVVGLRKDEFANLEELLAKGRACKPRASGLLLPHYGASPTIGPQARS